MTISSSRSLSPLTDPFRWIDRSSERPLLLRMFLLPTFREIIGRHDAPVALFQPWTSVWVCDQEELTCLHAIEHAPSHLVRMQAGCDFRRRFGVGIWPADRAAVLRRRGIDFRAHRRGRQNRHADAGALEVARQ